MANPLLLASDHAGFALKAHLASVLERWGVPFVDLGAHTDSAVDYPDFAAQLAGAIGRGQAERGVLICGTGIGMSIAANRFPHVRAALVHDETTARLAREHNDANVLVLGARLLAPEKAEGLLRIFLETPFAGARHSARVAKLGRLP